jgi:hypothetical protein
VAEHREIAQAMRQRDAERAALLMGHHIGKARCHLLRLQSVLASAPDLDDRADTEPRKEKRSARDLRN